ncbi:MAG TPA: two-component regulator propeller domain-containing protein [Candidatus Paceibacterota bacterium]|nr:two-component regulator propeller domain-containing protein [Verrucomicrobiota bacterium]HSA09482.1 two-component regulator propeller domain-containing protein [Candidatus Paceibacterota bacterium]
MLAAAAVLGGAARASAVVLWSDLGATLAHETGNGTDILGGALKRDNSSHDTLFFKFHVEPLSDAGTEEYFAAFQLFEGEAERLGVGNSLKAWAYSAFNTTTNGEFNKVFGDMDLRSAQPESSSPGVFLPYELPRRGAERTIVLKVNYVSGGEDLITVWLNPDLSPGATESSQPERLTTTFSANASFDEIRLRHGGGGGGWTFSDMQIATAFGDFVFSGGPGEGGGDRAGGGLALTFRAWGREQGLPQNVVHALAQTRDGYLWLGSDDGLARFDGVRFVSFGLREGLRSGPVRVLFEDSQGALWIGTAGGGLTRWQDGQFTSFSMRDGLPSDSITALGEDNEGQLWVGTEAGLALWQNGRLATPGAAAAFKGKAITALHRNRRGLMWLGATGLGIFCWQEGRFVSLSDASVEGLLQNPHCLLEDNAGRIWVGAGDDFVLCLDGGQWRRYRIPRHLARPYVSALAEEADGTVWAGSVSEGLFRFREGKLAAINASIGLLDNSVEALLVDREGNLWVGTAAGLNRLRRSNLLVLGQNEGLGYGPVQGLAEVAPGVIWAAKPNDGLYQWGGRGFTRLNVAGLPRRYSDTMALLRTRDGNCWMSAEGGLWCFKDPQHAPGDAKLVAQPGFDVIALAEERDGGVWAGTREGQVWRLRRGEWAAWTNYWQSHPVTAILEDPEGTMWIGTGGDGLHCYKGQSNTHLRKGDKLLSDWIRALYLDPAGTLWIGSLGGGLSRWRNGQLATFTASDGLPDNTISQILEDDKGRLWLGSNRGIACVSKQELGEWEAGRVPSLYPQVFGRVEGMPSEECTGGFCPAGLKMESGWLCFATLKGIVAAVPGAQNTEASAPSVVLEEAMIDGVVATPRRSRVAGEKGKPSRAASVAETEIRVRPGKHRLEFRYTGMNFSSPEQVRFRYRLEPLERDWVEAGAMRTAFYSYVPPGNYHFRVTACNSGGTWNEAGAGLALVVMPHFWQAWWFLGLVSLVLLASGAGAVRLVEKRKHQRRMKLLEQERALERERARIAQDLHDDLGSSLTRISLLSDLARTDKDNPSQVETHAQKISQSAGQTVRALEEIVWALRPGSDSLQSLVEYIAHFANELFEGDTARCRLDLPHDLPARSLPPEMRHSIFLVVKEALTNALKHSHAREVQVQAKASPQALEIVIRDDGQGFVEGALPATPGKRHGLGNMRQRAESMGGALAVESVPGKGTTVRLSLRFPA